MPRGSNSEIGAAAPCVSSYAEHKITHVEYLHLLRCLQDVWCIAMKRAKQLEGSQLIEDQILLSHPLLSRSSPDPDPSSLAPPPEEPPPLQAVGTVLAEGILITTPPPRDSALGRSPSYSPTENMSEAGDDEEEVAAVLVPTSTDNHHGDASQLPISDLTCAFTQVAQSTAPPSGAAAVPQLTATGNRLHQSHSQTSHCLSHCLATYRTMISGTITTPRQPRKLSTESTL